jgi:tetratricopeptide (TPR) repeat protein
VKFCIVLLAMTVILSGCGLSPQAAKDKGFEFYDLQKYKEALPLLEKAFAGKIDDPELIVRLAYCRAMIKGDPSSAIDILRDSVLKYPKYARTYFELGFIAHNFGPNENNQNLIQAMGFMRKAIELDSTEWKFKDNLGMFYFMQGQLDSAEIWWKAAYKLKTDYPELNTRLQQIAELKIEKARQDSVAADSLKKTEKKSGKKSR